MSKEAMKLALEALEQERENYQDWDKQEGTPEYIYEAITALKTALAEQPEQEPVAWIVEDQSGERLEWASDAHSCHGVPTFPLYTSPPAQRTWVGLTDAETEHLWEISRAAIPRYHTFKTLIEKALRERNT